MKRVEVSRLRTFFICGSGKVIHISDTSPGAKKWSMSSIDVRRKATLASPSCNEALAPVHMRAPLMSTPIKFFCGYLRASPTAYSPLPQPSSSTMGLSFLKKVGIPAAAHLETFLAQHGKRVLKDMRITAHVVEFL